MFESLGASHQPKRRFGAGALLAAGAHAAALAVVIHVSAHPAPEKHDAPEVTLRLAAPSPPPPPPPPPLGGPSVARSEARKKTLPVKRDVFVPKTPTENTKPPAPAPAADPESAPGGQEGGEPGGEAGGQLGGQHGGTAGGTGTVVAAAPPPPPPPPMNVVLPFGEGMNRPELLAGPEPEYPRAAREAKIEGTLLAKCVITTRGSLERCRILKSLPFLDQPVLDALLRRRYTPVTFQGRAVAVEYVIPFRFRLQ